MNHIPPRCAGCRRPLKRPSPDGLGPVCRKRLTRRPPRIRTTTSTDQLDGQLEIQLQPMQPTFWTA